MKRLYASIDIGTTRIKARLYDEELNTVYSRDVENKTYMKPGGVAEQDPEFLYGTVKALTKELLDRGAHSIGVATYRGSLVVWDEEGRPLTNIITWMDTRSRRRYNELPYRVKLVSWFPRIRSALTPESMAVKLAILSRDQRILRNGLTSGKLHAWNIDAYIAFKIIKRYSSDASNAALTGLIHPKNLRPIKPVLSLLGLKGIKVPEILCHNKAIGYLKGASFGPTIGDQQASSIALRCIDTGCLRMSLGTGLFLGYATGQRLYITDGFIPLILYCNDTSINYGVELYAAGLGKVVEWFVYNIMGGDYNLFNRYIKPEYNGPIIIPFIWGLREPRIRELSSGIIGISSIHSIGDLINSLAHSIAAIMSLLYKRIERIGKPKNIVVTGGLTRISNLVKLVSSYIGKPLAVSKSVDDSAIGAAIIAAKSIGYELSYSPKTLTVEPSTEIKPVDPELLVEAAGTIEKLVWEKLTPRL